MSANRCGGSMLRLVFACAILLTGTAASVGGNEPRPPDFLCNEPERPVLSDDEAFAQASILPDGRHVYVDMDGRRVFDRAGRRLSADELAAYGDLLPTRACRVPQAATTEKSLD